MGIANFAKNAWNKAFGKSDATTGLASSAIALVVLAVVLGVGATVLSNVQTTQTSGTIAYNVTGQGLTAMNTYGTWLTTIAVISAAAVVLALLFQFFRPAA